MKTEDAINAALGETKKTEYALKLEDSIVRSAVRRSEAEPVTPSNRSKTKKTAIPKDGYAAICVDGPMKGMQTRVKNPSAPVLAPMVNDPHYYCAVYKVTNQITSLGEIACQFSHLLSRKKES
jgi:hypothetical protein